MAERLRGIGASAAALAFAAAMIPLLAALAPKTAHACQPERPKRIHIPRPTWDGPLELVDEHIEVVCRHARGRKLICDWRSTHVYEGPAGLAVDGEVVLDSAVTVLRDTLRVDGTQTATQTLHTEDAARVEVERELSFEIPRMRPGYCYEGAAIARHMLVTTYYHESVLTVHDPPLPELDARSQVHVRVPLGWGSQFALDPDPVRAREREASVDSSELGELWIVRDQWFAHGPVVGAGVGFGPSVRARLRAGYEISIPSFLLISAAVEGDAVEELMLVPAIEAATAVRQVVIPSFGIGLGAPVMLLPDTRPGVRVQWSMKWWYVGLVGNVDIYPPREGQPRTLRGALMIEVSI